MSVDEVPGNIKTRQPGLEGLALHNQAVDDFMAPGPRRLHFFDDQKRRLLGKHPGNNSRGQTQTVEHYTGGLLRCGLQPHCRGCVIATPEMPPNQNSAEESDVFPVGHTTLT